MHDEQREAAVQDRSQPARFEALDGWRGICALLVVLFHAPVAGIVHETAFFRHGYLFVDFFFVLSGFVIAHAFYDRLRGEKNFGRFFGLRLFRVYPLHLFMLALFVAFECLMLVTKGPSEAFVDGNSVVALVHNLLMSHSFGTVDTLGWNYPSWSISAELLAYGLFALLVIRAPRAMLPLMAVTIVVGLVVIALVEGTMDTTVRFGWLRCLAGFSLGAVLRMVIWPRAGGRVAVGGTAWTLAELACVLLVAVFVSELGGSVLSVAAPLVFAFAIYVFGHEGGAVSRLLKAGPIDFLGAISYSVYMTHAFVISRAENVATVLGDRTGWPIFSAAADGKRLMGSTEWQSLTALAIILAGTIIMSAITWRLIERPGMAYGQKRLSRKSAPVSGGPADKPVADGSTP
ncbi:putative acyltransferase [Aurantimonas manganoxydans SI85-9A1]|uniref:Putative acyltransferase n=1 Tax=Aurantimonas manganoxydans (strain ATCC BAA-1229 / DSM 21871 / SI85-9A1) TaxID=287752 RepID=Q1YH90_AURMS|nr:acyltransferase [Aurantimonas manganoxydans]EAS49689.1 putative acyltransferase [Aurantimonas manganoxydans SI85-9A1]